MAASDEAFALGIRLGMTLTQARALHAAVAHAEQEPERDGRALEALGRWHEQLVAESLAKQGRGPTPLTAVAPRDLHARGQQLRDGRRDAAVTHLVVAAPAT